MALKPASRPTLCPFNKQHIVPSDRLQHHVIKCMKNYPNHYVCPYHSLHRFLTQAERNEHILKCESNKLTTSLPPEDPSSHGRVIPTRVPDEPQNGSHYRSNDNDDDEDWEREYN